MWRPGHFGETGSACIQAWVSAWLSYASSSDSPPLLLFSSLPGNPYPPLLGRGERLDLKIGSVVLPDLPLHANRRISFYPPLSHPCLYSVNPSRISLPSQLLMVLILRATVRLSGAKTQRSPSPRAPLQSVHIEPLCSRVLHPPFTMHLHKQTHFLACPTFVSTILWEKANETDVHLSNNSPYLGSQLLLVICWGGSSSGLGCAVMGGLVVRIPGSPSCM